MSTPIIKYPKKVYLKHDTFEKKLCDCGEKCFVPECNKKASIICRIMIHIEVEDEEYETYCVYHACSQNHIEETIKSMENNFGNSFFVFPDQD